MLTRLLPVTLCLLPALASPGAADPLAFAKDRCILPQIEGRALPVNDLTPITAAEAGASPPDGGPDPEFFRADSGEIVARLFLFSLRACRVTDIPVADFEALAEAFVADMKALGLDVPDTCNTVDRDGFRMVVAALPDRTDRMRFATVTLSEANDPGFANVLSYETGTSNVPLDCDPE